MGLVLGSHENRLLLTGIPSVLEEGRRGDDSMLVFDFLCVSNPSREVVESNSDIRIPLSAEWADKVQKEVFRPDRRLVIEVELASPANPLEKERQDILAACGSGLYEIKSIRSEPHELSPVAP